MTTNLTTAEKRDLAARVRSIVSTLDVTPTEAVQIAAWMAYLPKSPETTVTPGQATQIAATDEVLSKVAVRTIASVRKEFGLTESGVRFMAMVGARKFDFFDDGIEEHSGNWGQNMAAQAHQMGLGKSAKSLGGIMAATKEAGLWYNSMQDTSNGQDMWWSLTIKGAEAALAAAEAVYGS